VTSNFKTISYECHRQVVIRRTWPQISGPFSPSLLSFVWGQVAVCADASFYDTYPCGDMGLEVGATLSYCTVGFFQNLRQPPLLGRFRQPQRLPVTCFYVLIFFKATSMAEKFHQPCLNKTTPLHPKLHRSCLCLTVTI